MGYLTKNQDHVKKMLQDRLNYITSSADMNHESIEYKKKELSALIAAGEQLAEEEQQLKDALDSLTPRCITCKQPLDTNTSNLNEC